MIGKRKNKVTVVVSSLLAGVILMTSCSVNTNGIGEAFSDLGNNLSRAAREEDEPEETEAVPAAETEETEITEETTVETEVADPTPTSTPVPTATPTPSPTPIPQRVDFSDLTEDQLTDSITIEIEDFSESAHAEDDDDILLAQFYGDRVLISSDEISGPITSVNLMLDAFYMEAEGIYNRVVNEQYAAYELDPDMVPDTKDVNVTYEYFFNGRLLCIIMSYSVVQDDEVLLSNIEYYRFDLYTGQIVYSDMLVNDVDAFYDALAEAVADSTATPADKAEDYQIEFFVVETDDDGESVVTAAVVTDDGFEYYVVEMPDLYESLTRYGRVVWNVTFVEVDEEDVDDEEDIEDDEEEDEDEDEESSDEDEETLETEESEDEEEEEEEEER